MGSTIEPWETLIVNCNSSETYRTAPLEINSEETVAATMRPQEILNILRLVRNERKMKQKQR